MSTDALAKERAEGQEVDFASEFNQLIRLDIVKSLEAWYASDFERRITELAELLKNQVTQQLRQQFNSELEAEREKFNTELNNHREQSKFELESERNKLSSELETEREKFNTELNSQRQQSKLELENQIQAMRTEYESRMDSQLEKWDSDRKALQQELEDQKKPVAGLKEEIAGVEERMRQKNAVLKEMMSDDSLPLGSIMEAKFERMEMVGYLKGLNFLRRDPQ